jgi:hypothetical protein
MSLLDRLANEEQQFLDQDFLSPALKGFPIKVRIAGVVMSLQIRRPKNFEGWGIFRPDDYKTARFVREPNMQEKAQYLELFPAVRFVLCSRKDDQWKAMPYPDNRFKFKGLIPIKFVQEGQMFQTIIARFDGQTFWYHQVDLRHNPKTAVDLRAALADLKDDVEIPGLTKIEKNAYELAFVRELENRKDLQEERIKKALEKGGAKYLSYLERGNTYTVEFTVDGMQHRSVVDKKNLSVQTAGICLVDHSTNIAHDSDFDLQSLVGVIREGQGGGHIYRV